MSLKNRLLKIAGKSGLVLDEKISTRYIVFQCWKYGWMLIRGKWLFLFCKNINGKIFIGKNVKVYGKKQLKAGKNCKFHDNVYIDTLSYEGVTLGDLVIIGRNGRVECTGSLEYVGKGVKIGTGSTFGNDCFFGAAGGIEIGNDVVAGQYIRFHSENHNFDDLDKPINEQGVNHKGIKVGNNCWIGSGAVFLDGAELGDGCVVAANAVINKRFDDNSVIGGVPAKILRYRGQKGIE